MVDTVCYRDDENALVCGCGLGDGDKVQPVFVPVPRLFSVKGWSVNVRCVIYDSQLFCVCVCL